MTTYDPAVLKMSSVYTGTLTPLEGTTDGGVVSSPLKQMIQTTRSQDFSSLVSVLFSQLSSVVTASSTQAQLQPSQTPETPDYITVNDSVIADPLMTLPLYIMDAMSMKKASLCYDLHGKPNVYYNFVSDSCVSVNAHYQTAFPGQRDIRIIVFDEIALRAVDRQGSCIDIAVGVSCIATINGARLTFPQYIKDGISVYQYADRVRLSVPNCKHQQLVLWVMCQSYQISHPTSGVPLDVRSLKLVVARALSLNEDSHGLIAQFWGVPISLVPYTGQYRGQPVTTGDFYVVSLATKPRPRRFVAHWNAVSWDFREGPCLYAGSSNGGPVREVVAPNDAVIEGIHTDYIVKSTFSTSFKYSRFVGNCTRNK